MPFFADSYVAEKIYQPDRPRLRALLDGLDAAHETTKGHGDALEDLTREIFGACKLFENLDVDRVAMGQIDFACRVLVLPGWLTQDWSTYIVGECKHHAESAGFADLATFSRKVENANANVGILASTEGVSGDWEMYTDALGIVRDDFGKGRRILCIVRSDLESIVEGESLICVLRRKMDDLHFPERYPKKPKH